MNTYQYASVFVDEIKRAEFIDGLIENFDLSVPDSEKQVIINVSGLSELIWKYVRHAEVTGDEVNDLHRWFNDFFSEQFAVSLSIGISPETNPNKLLGGMWKIKKWKKIQSRSPYALPGLMVTKQWKILTWILFFVLVFGLTWLVVQTDWSEGLRQTIVVGTGVIFALLMDRNRQIPQKTLKEMEEDILFYNLIEIGETIGFTRENIRYIVEREIGFYLPKKQSKLTRLF